MIERPGARSSSESPTTIMASLSLYLIILAFFIMMNTISKSEGSRTEGVLASITNSFQELTETTVVTLELSTQGAGVDKNPGFEKSIAELFETSFPLAEVEPSKAFGQIEVTLPVASLFTDGATSVTGRNEAVLDRLAKIMQIKTPDKAYEVEMLFSAAPDDYGFALTVDRAGTLARELSARGVRAAAIAIGLEHLDAASMRMLFVIRTLDETDPGAVVADTAGDGS